MGAHRKKAPKSTEPQPPRLNAPRPRAIPEKLMNDVHKLLDAREFKGIEEANRFLATLTGPGLENALQELDDPPTPQEEAQELARQAMDATTAGQARKLAKQSLAKDPDCVDALIVLTEVDAKSAEEAIFGMERAVAAGERSMGGADFFKKNKGSFWGLMNTRPYMRARFELADLLLDDGRISEAVPHFEALLELNPNDNQGVRDALLGCYLAQDDLDGAGRLLRDYPGETSAVFSWGRVLAALLAGEVDNAQRALNRARKQNRYVERYLSGELLPTQNLPDSFTFGSKEEAILCVVGLSDALASHPDWMLWIWEQLGFTPPPEQVFQGRLF